MMRDYYVLDNYSVKGTLGISKRVFASIAKAAVSEVSGTHFKKPKSKILSLLSPVSVRFNKNGRVIIAISVDIKKDFETAKVATEIQKQVAENIELMCDQVPFKIEINVGKAV